MDNHIAGWLLGSLIPLLLGILIIFVFAQKYLLVVTVISDSMSPTLERGDRILVLRRYPTSRIAIDQIAVVEHPEQPCGFVGLSLPTKVVKRIVGLPGDLIAVDSDNVVHRHAPSALSNLDSAKRVYLIPSKHLFLVGDNTGASEDSRIWGPIPESAVIGILVACMKRTWD